MIRDPKTDLINNKVWIMDSIKHKKVRWLVDETKSVSVQETTEKLKTPLLLQPPPTLNPHLHAPSIHSFLTKYGTVVVVVFL